MEGRLVVRRALRLGSIVVALLGLVLVARPAASNAAQPTPTPRPTFASPEAAFRAALDVWVGRVAPGRRFQLGQTQRFDTWAYAYAQEVDAGGRPVAERFVALLGRQEAVRGWYALAPQTSAPDEYNALLDLFPPALLDAGHKAYLRQPDVAAAVVSFAGHRLPWPAGQLAYVTQKDGEHHLHEVDFDIQGLAAAGEVCATKPGRVVFVKQSGSGGACDPTYFGRENLVVVQHESGEYSWYLHLAPGSVALRVGQEVGYGARIGLEGATGYACGVHLHYMVSTDHTPWTDPNDPNVLPWALGIVSVDFAETPWAGLAEGEMRTSLNSPGPGGVLTGPTEGIVVDGTTALLQGQVFATDLAYARFIASYGGAWHPVGPEFTKGRLGFYWDLCAAGVPDGPVAIGLEVVDTSGNTTRPAEAQRHIVKRHTCAEAPRLQIVQPLVLTPAGPAVGQPVTAQFTVRNAGQQTVTLPRLAAVGQGPGVAEWPAVDGVTLRAYEDYVYHATYTLAQAGNYQVQPVYQDGAGAWQPLSAPATPLAVAAR